ncbi:MAG: GNAT family N-acetyltransferase [Acidobacteriota bacterium]
MPNSFDSTTREPSLDAIVRPIEPADIPAAKAFLEAHIDTSVYLLSNMSDLGIRSTSHPMSGNFLLIEEDGELVGVFCLTLRGDLLAQTGRRTEFASLILSASRPDTQAILGVLAEWRLAEALWSALTMEPGFTPVYERECIVYGITRVPAPRTVSEGIVIRAMSMADYGAWEPVDRAFCAEEGLAVMPDEVRRRNGYQSRADVGGWWGAFAEGLLVSTACLNAGYQGIGQVGGVYTRPAYRRLGIGQQVMHELMRYHEARNGLQEVVLFTADRNHTARAFYESMGFSQRDRFGLLFRLPGERP